VRKDENGIDARVSILECGGKRQRHAAFGLSAERAAALSARFSGFISLEFVSDFELRASSFPP